MANLSITETVNAPVDRVFAAFTNFENAAQTVSGISKVEMLTDGPIGVGTRFKETRVMFGREATEEMEVTAFEPGKNYTLSAESCGAHFASTFVFVPQGNSTEVTMSLNTKAITMFAKLMSPLSFLMKGTMKKCIEADFADLKKLCEDEAGVAA